MVSGGTDTARRADTRWERQPFALASWAFRIVVFGCFALTTVVLLLYVAHFFRADFSSDDAVLNLLAEAMYEQGRLLPRGWVVNNGDLMMPSGALLIAPLLAWWPNGFGLHAVASVTLSVTLLALAAGFLRLQRIAWPAVLVTLTLLASGFSKEFTVMVYGQTTYFWWPAGFLAGASLLLLHHRRRADAAPTAFRRQFLDWRLALLALVVAAISFANPNRVLVMMVLPLYAFDRMLAWQALPESRRGLRARLVALLPASPAALTITIAFLVSAVAYRWLMHAGVTATQHFVSALQLADGAGVREHVRIFVNGWFDYMGASSSSAAGKPWEPFLRTIRTSIALALTAVAILELRDWRVDRDPVRRALFAAFLTAFVPLLALFLLFSPLALDMQSLRYFTVPYVLLLMLAAYRIGHWLRQPSRLTLALVAGGCLLVTAGAVHRLLPFGATFWTTRNSNVMNLAAVLQREGLTRGYASWWNAGGTTVSSDAAVRVQPITLAPTLLHPFPVMVNRAWFDPAAYAGPTFLALTGPETQPEQLTYIETRLGPPARVLHEAGYRIQVYDHNIATDFTCLDMRPLLDEPLAEADFPKVRIVAAAFVTPMPGSGADAGTGLRVRLRNDTARWIGAAGAYPVTIGVHLNDASGALVNYDWLHATLNCPLAPGEERTMGVMLPSAPPGAYRITVDLVQENVAWFADKGGATLSLPLEIR